MNLIKNNYVLLLLFVLYFLIPIEFRLLWQPDELRYAEISREMLASHNWIVPHFFDLRYFEKPVAGYWINNISQLILGHTNFAVRFGSVFSVSITALMVFWLAKSIWSDRSTALMASVIFLTGLLVYGVGTYAALDSILTMWLTAIICAHWYAVQAKHIGKKCAGWLLMGFACAIGVMTKGFLALVVPTITLLPWAIWQKRLREHIIYGLVALLAAVILILPWALAIAHQEPDFWHYFFWVEHIQRFARDDAQHLAPVWFYLPILLLACLPWVALLPGSLKLGWQERHTSSGSFYLLLWVVLPFVFFSMAKGKLLTYIMPCFVPLSILMARHGVNLSKQNGVTLRVNGWINVLFGLIATVAVVGFLAPWGIESGLAWQTHEKEKVVIAATIFLAWSLVGWITLKQSAERWSWAALCPLMLALLVGAAIPANVINNKQPQPFIHEIASELKKSRYILTNNPGVGSGIAWILQRSDICFYDLKGELAYGLSYPDAADKFVSRSDFSHWLMKNRLQGNVSLVLLLSDTDAQSFADLPLPDFILRQGRLVLYYYNQSTNAVG